MDIGRIAHGGVYIYRGELDFMARTILDSPHMETGGNLFGYWTPSGDAVIMYVLGPGRKSVCRLPVLYKMPIICSCMPIDYSKSTISPISVCGIRIMVWDCRIRAEAMCNRYKRVCWQTGCRGVYWLLEFAIGRGPLSMLFLLYVLAKG